MPVERLWTEPQTIRFDWRDTPSIVEIHDEFILQGETYLQALRVVVRTNEALYTKCRLRWRLDEMHQTFNTLGEGEIGEFWILEILPDRNYLVEVTLISDQNQRARPYVYQHYAGRRTVAPSDVADLSINIHGETATLIWPAVPEIDISHFQIRHSHETVGATYSAAQILIEKVARPATTVDVPMIVGTFFIKSFDKSGNESVGAASVVLSTEDARVQGLNVVAELREEPQFDGTKTDLTVIGDQGTNYLQLAAAGILFDDAPGEFDDAPGEFDLGAGTATRETVLPEGNYVFGPVDLGAIYFARVVPHIDIDRLNFSELFDDTLGHFDSRAGLFDGGSHSVGDTFVELEISTRSTPLSLGNSGWSPWKKLITGSFYFRAARFRLILRSTNQIATPRISELLIEIDMAERAESASDIAVTGYRRIPFGHHFYSTPTIVHSADNLADGERTHIFNKTKMGFDVEILSGPWRSTRTTQISYIAQGVGRS